MNRREISDHARIPGHGLPRPRKARMRGIRWLAVIALALAGSAALAQRPPNIVLLVGDDHGYPYFGFMGDEHVVTPSMDALAAGGMTFSHAHVTSSYCRPSLRTLVTGLHPVQYVLREMEILERRRRDADYAALDEAQRGLWEQVEKAAAMREFDTLPKLLGEAGYASWQGGKWWENSWRNGHFTAGMSDGWDLSAYGGDGFFEQLMGGEGNDLVRETMEPLFDFIDSHREQPFFIWFAPSLPHVPFDAPYTYSKYYQDMDISESAKLYYSNVTWWDDGVGRLLDHIESRELMQDTLFVYISDNGWQQDADVEYKQREDSTVATDLLLANGGPLGKNGLYDLSFRSPLVFHWEGRIGHSFNTSSLVSSMDIVPTLLDIAGAEIPEDLPGYSLLPLIEGRSMPERTHIVGYTDNRRSTTSPMGERAEGYSVRTRRWQFLWYADTDEKVLYDITVDRLAERNLAADYPELVAEFQTVIEDWKTDMGMSEAITIYE